MAENLSAPIPRAYVDLAEFHQDRYLDRDEDPALRRQSAEWLMERGFIGCRGVQLLPFGELP